MTKIYKDESPKKPQTTNTLLQNSVNKEKLHIEDSKNTNTQKNK